MSCSVVSDSLRSHGLQPIRLPLSMRFSRQEYWRGLPFPSPGGLPNPGMEPVSPTLRADTLLTEPGKPKKGSDTHETGISHLGWLWPGAQAGVT